jgi:protein gp37
MNPIGWCDKTVNFVRGCNGINGVLCPYCYARRFNIRTWKEIYRIENFYRMRNHLYESSPIFEDQEILKNNMKDFKPVFMYSQFVKPLPKKSMRIFLDSMSDIAYWQPEWIKFVLDKIKKYPQHKFIFLTKKASYRDIEDDYKDWLPSNIWWGNTITTNKDLYNACLENHFECVKYFLSIEPILENINLNEIENIGEEFFNGNYPFWIIVGAETGNRKEKIIPKLEWIENIKEYCQKNEIPYFEKNSLKNIVKRDLIKQFPSNLG